MRNGYFKTSEESTDSFVGLRFKDGIPEVVFPHGYNLSENEVECRKDVFRLLNVLKKFTDLQQGNTTNSKKETITQLPISSYQYIIHNYLNYGYYTETEEQYVKSQKGKINWKRTIQQEKPQLDGSNVVYLNFQTKTNQINTNNLLSKIHQYCVYLSFLKFGWLYMSSNYLPQKPIIKFDKKLFISTLEQAISNTFNESKQKLFRSMINILNEENDEINIRNKSYGVEHFETIWEQLIDHVFGEDDKKKYFPHATWHIIKNDKVEKSSALEPDTIMKYNGKTYVLDAKYYQYGISQNPKDLPNTSSIQKQITYGKHIAEQFYKGSENSVYSAFVLPYKSENLDKWKFVSIGSADWEEYNSKTYNYAYILALLLDSKWIINEYSRHNDYEIEKLANLIETSLNSYRLEYEKTNS